jgi:hypothetical protein
VRAADLSHWQGSPRGEHPAANSEGNDPQDAGNADDQGRQTFHRRFSGAEGGRTVCAPPSLRLSRQPKSPISPD